LGKRATKLTVLLWLLNIYKYMLLLASQFLTVLLLDADVSYVKPGEEATELTPPL
jgi:hypothetical protein